MRTHKNKASRCGSIPSVISFQKQSNLSYEWGRQTTCSPSFPKVTVNQLKITLRTCAPDYIKLQVKRCSPTIHTTVLATVGKQALTVFQRAELLGAAVRELDEVCRGPEWRCGQDVGRVAEVQVGQRAWQVTGGRRGTDAVIVPLFVPAKPATGAHSHIGHHKKQRNLRQVLKDKIIKGPSLHFN